MWINFKVISTQFNPKHINSIILLLKPIAMTSPTLFICYYYDLAVFINIKYNIMIAFGNIRNKTSFFWN